jgi:hypothetical protein
VRERMESETVKRILLKKKKEKCEKAARLKKKNDPD